jgi:hypothetical protein
LIIAPIGNLSMKIYDAQLDFLAVEESSQVSIELNKKAVALKYYLFNTWSSICMKKLTHSPFLKQLKRIFAARSNSSKTKVAHSQKNRLLEKF